MLSVLVDTLFEDGNSQSNTFEYCIDRGTLDVIGRMFLFIRLGHGTFFVPLRTTKDVPEAIGREFLFGGHWKKIVGLYCIQKFQGFHITLVCYSQYKGD